LVRLLAENLEAQHRAHLVALQDLGPLLLRARDAHAEPDNLLALLREDSQQELGVLAPGLRGLHLVERVDLAAAGGVELAAEDLALHVVHLAQLHVLVGLDREGEVSSSWVVAVVLQGGHNQEGSIALVFAEECYRPFVVPEAAVERFLVRTNVDLALQILAELRFDFE